MKNLNPLYEFKNQASKAAGKQLAKLISKKGARSANMSNAIDLLNNRSSGPWYTQTGFYGTNKTGSGTILHGAQKVLDKVSAAKGARLLSKGQDAVGKGRKTLKGKAKQFKSNMNKVYNKIHSKPIIEN